MTERKPPGVSWQTWIDRQIEEGRARGEFDDLAGHGKPIPGIEHPRDELWWVRDKLRREEVEYLPPALAIRKQAAEAEQRALAATSEHEVRRIIGEINEEIRQLNRHSVAGPPTTLMAFDVEEVVEAWRRRPVPPEEPERPDIVQAPPSDPPSPGTATSRWWRWFRDAGGGR